MVAPLELERATARYDQQTHTVYVIYKGVLDAQTPVLVYDWLDLVYEAVDVDALRGQVFDFRQVKDFAQDNLVMARRSSNRMNMKTNISHCPVALIVGDFYHEEILRTAMRISPEHNRKQIVWSDEEAQKFLDDWHQANKS